MNKVQLQPGIYTNIFPVILADEPVSVMEISHAQVPDLRPLREEIKQTGVRVAFYAHKDRVYGYGKDTPIYLPDKGFAKNEMFLKHIPALATRVVVDGIVELALQKCFWKRWKNSPHRVEDRAEIFRPDPKATTTQGNVKVFVGYELRCVYYPSVESLGLVVDVTWAYQDENGMSLNTSQMRARNAMNEALIIQEEFLRGTNRFNLQISQIRMHNYLLPFAQEFQAFPLPCGGDAYIEPEPFPVILGGKA